jgi:hypothetical protein
MKKASESAKGNSKKPSVSQEQTAPKPGGQNSPSAGTAGPEVLAAIAMEETEETKKARYQHWDESRHYPISVTVAGCRMDAYSDVELLHALCESLAENAAAIRKQVVIPQGPEFLAVAMLEALSTAEIIAHQVAFDGRASEPHPVWDDKWKSTLDFKCFLPMAGLAGRRRLHCCRELLEAIAEPTFKLAMQISKLVLEPLHDVKRQLELAEALVIAEAVIQRRGADAKYDATAGAKLFPGGRPETFLERQAREVKFRALSGVEAL